MSNGRIKPGYCVLCGRRKATTRAMIRLGGGEHDLEVCVRCTKEFAPRTYEEEEHDLWEQERASQNQQIAAMHGDYSY